MKWRDCRTFWGADGAEVQDALAPFAYRRHLPSLRCDSAQRLTGCGGGEVVATFDGGVEGELSIGCVLLHVLAALIQYSVLVSGGIGDKV